MEKNFPDFAKMQLEQAIESFRMIQSLLSTVIPLFLAGDVTIIGVAIETKSPLIGALGSIFIALIWFYMTKARVIMKSLIFTAISIEKRYGSDGIDWTITTFFRQTGNEETYKRMIEIIAIDDEHKRHTKLKNIEVPGYIGNKIVADILIWSACILQLTISICFLFFP